MHTNLYLLVTISLLTGFFMRPFNMFVFGKAVSLTKYTDSKPLIFLLLFGSMLTTMVVSITTIYLSLKITGFIPMGDHLPVFLVSFFIGGTLWVLYARKYNVSCNIDLD
mgnify:CR=1 FL=1